MCGLTENMAETLREVIEQAPEPGCVASWPISLLILRKETLERELGHVEDEIDAFRDEVNLLRKN